MPSSSVARQAVQGARPFAAADRATIRLHPSLPLRMVQRPGVPIADAVRNLVPPARLSDLTPVDRRIAEAVFSGCRLRALLVGKD